MKICNQCQVENPDELLFCYSCFSELPATTQAAIQESNPVVEELPTETIIESTSPTIPQTETLLAAPSTSQPQPERKPGQLGSGKRSPADIWGPFAGYGTRGRHQTWMLDEQGEKTGRLRDEVTARFARRRIPEAQIHRRMLTAKGIIVENRPYYLIERGITTMGLHIARFGEDLFISQVTYTRGPINSLRVLILIMMLFFQLFMMVGYSRVVQNAFGTFELFGGYTGNPTMLGYLLCCIGPLGIANTLLLILAGLHMIYKFLTEKNMFALLRRLPNEFELDDIVALEKSVEETVRQSLDAIDLDGSKMPPALQYGLNLGRLF